MKTILFVHQTSELYGSDRVLYDLVEGLKQRASHRIIVLMPNHGPLVGELNRIKVEIHVLPLIRLSRASFGLVEALKLPFRLIISLMAMSKALKNERIDIVHSNTLAVMSGAVWSFLNRVPHLWHVHEIILRPPIAGRVFALLLKIFSTKVVCNSRATMSWLLAAKPSLGKITSVIHNAVNVSATASRKSSRNFREELAIGDQEILITLAGRINPWKGQGLLIEAASILRSAGIKNLRFIIVGSPPPGQEHHLTKLKEEIKSLDDPKLLTHIDFTRDMQSLWEATDIAVVASTEPEPFGMVAVEAMAEGRPVVASNEGGLTEVVVDNETGILFKSRDAKALADALLVLINDSSLRERYGRAGQLRAKVHFNMSSFIDAFESTYSSILNR